MLEPVLIKEILSDEAHELLFKLKALHKTLELTPAQWLLVDPLINQTEKACIRRFRGDA